MIFAFFSGFYYHVNIIIDIDRKIKTVSKNIYSYRS